MVVRSSNTWRQYSTAESRFSDASSAATWIACAGAAEKAVAEAGGEGMIRV